MSGCVLAELERSVERSLKDFQTLKEDCQHREADLRALLAQVGLHRLSGLERNTVHFLKC